jgi:hypothetical protein
VDDEFPNRKQFPSRAHPPFFPSLLLGGNANGDKELKPLPVCKSENPRALMNVAKSSLPVIWKSHGKAWVTRQIVNDWFVEYFLPEMKIYCAEENLDFRILLILDNASVHVLDHMSLSENVKNNLHATDGPGCD